MSNELILTTLQQMADKMNATAAGLDAYVRDPKSADAIHPSHAANRLRKMAREINGGAK